jgi:hypothetical protein
LRNTCNREASRFSFAPIPFRSPLDAKENLAGLGDLPGLPGWQEIPHSHRVLRKPWSMAVAFSESTIVFVMLLRGGCSSRRSRSMLCKQSQCRASIAYLAWIANLKMTLSLGFFEYENDPGLWCHSLINSLIDCILMNTSYHSPPKWFKSTKETACDLAVLFLVEDPQLIDRVDPAS